jgi:hypothetical protein
MLDAREVMVSILSDTNDWLKFAEAKNGAVLAINCAIAFGLIRLLQGAQNLNDGLFYYSIFVMTQLFGSLTLSLISLLPRTNPPWWVKFPEKNDIENPLFFGSACKYSPKDYLNLIREVTGNSEHEKIHEHLSQQIVINSKIAFIKYSQFNKSAWLLISALLTPVGAYFLARVKE